MKIMLQVIVAIVAAAIGYWIGDTASSRPQEDESQVPPMVRAPIPDADSSALVETLRKRISDLERSLSVSSSVSQTALASDSEVTPTEERPPEVRRSPRERLEELRQRDPERFVQVTNRMARFQQFRRERSQSRQQYLAALDTSHMSRDEKATHTALQDALAAKERLEEQMHGGELSDDERHELFRQMRDLDREISGLNQQERTTLLKDTVNSLGLEGEDAEAVLNTISDIYEATNGEGRRGMPPPPDGGQEPPPGGAGAR